MGLVRRSVLFILSVLLLIGLIGSAFAVSSYLTLAKPNKVEDELTASGFYSHFADNAISQAQAASANTIGTENISFNNPAVKQAAHEALSIQLLQQQGNSLIDANYAWLEGKQAKPDFKVDLTAARQDFATKVGQAVSIRLATLPICSVAELAQLQASASQDPFSITCRPSALNAQTEGTTVAKEISQSSAFLNNAVITPDSITPSSGQPYYQKFSWAPQAYRLALKAPYVWGGLTVLLVFVVVLIAQPKQKGFRRIGVTMVVAGLLLLLNKMLADILFNSLQKQAFNPANSGQLQQSGIDFAHRLESQLVRVDLYFSIAFVVLGLLLVLLARARKSAGRKDKAVRAFQAPAPTAPVQNHDTSNFRAAQPGHLTMVDDAPSGRPAASTPQAQPRKRPPRLIQ